MTSSRSPPSRPARTSAGAAKTSSGARRCSTTGRVLRPQDLGVLSSIGLGYATVVRKPRVRLVITGNELLPSGHGPHGFHIADANGPMLAALVERDGGSSTSPASCATMRMPFCEALHADADVVIVSGGSSVGIEDLAPTLVAAHGELAIHGIAMRPSSPTGLGRIGDRLVFLLPGNPVSCSVRLRLLRRPRDSRARRPADGVAVPLDPRARWRARSARRSAGSTTRACTIRRTARRAARRLGGASVLSSTTRADGFVIVADDSEGFAAGSRSRRSGSMREQEQFLQVLDRDEAERRFRAALDLTPRGIEHGPARRGARPRAGRRRHLARRRAVVRPLERRWLRGGRRGHLRRVRGSAARASSSADEMIHTGVVPATVIRPGERRGDCHRRHDAARRRCGRDGRARRRQRAASCGSPAPSPPAAACRSPAPTSPPAKPCCAAVSPDQPRHRRAGRDRRRRRSTSGASRSSPSSRPATRSSLPGAADAAGARLRLERAGARRCGARAGRRAASPRHRPGRCRCAASEGCATRSTLADVVLLSGGTSKGAGDVSYRVVAELTDPGIVAHGVALKPGKPICLAATRRAPGRRPARLSDVGDLHVP